MAPRYRTKTAAERQSDQAQKQADQLRKQIRDDLMREFKTAFNSWKKEIESEFSQSIKTASSGSGSSDIGSSDIGAGLGAALAGLAFSLITTNRKQTRTSEPVESGRSLDENSFYRQSISQHDAALGAAVQKGQRNL